MTNQTTKNNMRIILLEFVSIAAQGVAYYPKWTPVFLRKELDEVWKDKEAFLRKQINVKFTISDLKNLGVEELHEFGFFYFDKNLLTIPLWIYNYIADGEELICINNEKRVKGKDNIDLDVRRGCIAYGFYI